MARGRDHAEVHSRQGSCSGHAARYSSRPSYRTIGFFPGFAGADPNLCVLWPCQGFNVTTARRSSATLSATS